MERVCVSVSVLCECLSVVSVYLCEYECLSVAMFVYLSVLCVCDSLHGVVCLRTCVV